MKYGGFVLTVTTMLHCTQDEGFSITHTTKFRLYIPNSSSRVGEALIVCVPAVDVEEVVA